MGPELIVISGYKWGYNYNPYKWPEIKWEPVFFFFHPCTWRHGPRLVTGFRGPLCMDYKISSKKYHGFPMEKTFKNYSVSLGKGLKKWCLNPFSLNVAILTNSLHLNNPGTGNLYTYYIIHLDNLHPICQLLKLYPPFFL